MGPHRVGYDWSNLACMHACIGEGNGNPLQCSCLENPRDGGVWWAAIYGVTQGWTWLKRLSSSSSILWFQVCVAHHPLDSKGLICKPQIFSLANSSQNKEFAGRCMEHLTERGGASGLLKIMGTQSQADLCLMPLSRGIHSNHFPFLRRGVRIHIPWILIGLAGVICSC